MSNAYIYAPETIIKAYSLGVFPMAESREDGAIHFYEPLLRGILPIAPPHIPRRLLRLVRQTSWRVTINQDFRAVIEGCAEPTESRADSWINPEIIRLYLALHKMGFAHSFEVWEGDTLIGGLYGIRLGSAFFGESMFSRRSNASKIALAHLMARLYFRKFTLLDAQFANDHLRQFGLLEIPKKDFQTHLQAALAQPAELPLDIEDKVIFDHLAQAKTLTS
jgi:leucyl/phenylalanyl-tRNA--protein transferase